MRRKSILGELFAEALKNENSSNFEAAILSYETALTIVKKNRFNNNSLENSIAGKLKTLYTVTAYNKNFDPGK